MKRWVLVVVVAAGFVLAGCASPGPDEATVRACNLLATAEDQIADGINAYIASGKPKGGSQDVRDAIQNYPVLISQAASEALSAAPGLSASFQESADNAAIYQQAMGTRDSQTASAAKFAIQGTVDKCEAAGVSMQISDTVSG